MASKKWEQAKASRVARRFDDPRVQSKRKAHENKEAAKRRHSAIAEAMERSRVNAQIAKSICGH